MIDEQTNIKLGTGELRNRECGEAHTDRGPGDRDRIDRIRLAALPGRVTGARRQLRCDAHDPLAPGEQEPFQRTRDVAAVLERPHPICLQAAAPQQQVIERPALGAHCPLSDHATCALI
jgi:hypothetical protein